MRLDKFDKFNCVKLLLLSNVNFWSDCGKPLKRLKLPLLIHVNSMRLKKFDKSGNSIKLILLNHNCFTLSFEYNELFNRSSRESYVIYVSLLKITTNSF